jgi:hypothetical protein
MTLAGITALMSRSLAEQPTQRRKMAREDSHSAQQRDQQTGNSENLCPPRRKEKCSDRKPPRWLDAAGTARRTANGPPGV